MKRVGVLVEEQRGRMKPAMLGVVTAGQGEGHELWALTFEGSIEGCQDELRDHGVDKTVDVRSDACSLAWGPDVRAQAVVRAVEELGLDVLLGLSSQAGRDLLARIAAALDTSLVLDCLDVDLDASTATKLLYSGKSLATIRAWGRCPVFGLRPGRVRPNAVEPRRRPGEGEVVSFVWGVEETGVKAVELREGDSREVPLTEAEIIISGGRGMGGGESFEALRECAEVLGAAVGASRVAVDAGWVPHSMQVGLTGTTVSPRLYVACGISGAAQHFAGMGTAGTLVAINTDRDAAMMQGCDYGIVGDLFEVVPILTRQLKAT